MQEGPLHFHFISVILSKTKKGPMLAHCMLSAREKTVLALIGSGRTTKEIAHALGLSPLTVAGHRKQICSKLRLHSTAEVIAYALRNADPKARPLVAEREDATASGN